MMELKHINNKLKVIILMLLMFILSLILTSNDLCVKASVNDQNDFKWDDYLNKKDMSVAWDTLTDDEFWKQYFGFISSIYGSVWTGDPSELIQNTNDFTNFVKNKKLKRDDILQFAPSGKVIFSDKVIQASVDYLKEFGNQSYKRPLTPTTYNNGSWMTHLTPMQNYEYYEDDTVIPNDGLWINDAMYNKIMNAINDNKKYVCSFYDDTRVSTIDKFHLWDVTEYYLVSTNLIDRDTDYGHYRYRNLDVYDNNGNKIMLHNFVCCSSGIKVDTNSYDKISIIVQSDNYISPFFNLGHYFGINTFYYTSYDNYAAEVLGQGTLKSDSKVSQIINDSDKTQQITIDQDILYKTDWYNTYNNYNTYITNVYKYPETFPSTNVDINLNFDALIKKYALELHPKLGLDFGLGVATQTETEKFTNAFEKLFQKLLVPDTVDLQKLYNDTMHEVNNKYSVLTYPTTKVMDVMYGIVNYKDTSNFIIQSPEVMLHNQVLIPKRTIDVNNMINNNSSLKFLYTIYLTFVTALIGRLLLRYALKIKYRIFRGY